MFKTQWIPLILCVGLMGCQTTVNHPGASPLEHARKVNNVHKPGPTTSPWVEQRSWIKHKDISRCSEQQQFQNLLTEPLRQRKIAEKELLEKTAKDIYAENVAEREKCMREFKKQTKPPNAHQREK